jgi:hypothetical protein
MELLLLHENQGGRIDTRSKVVPHIAHTCLDGNPLLPSQPRPRNAVAAPAMHAASRIRATSIRGRERRLGHFAWAASHLRRALRCASCHLGGYAIQSRAQGHLCKAAGRRQARAGRPVRMHAQAADHLERCRTHQDALEQRFRRGCLNRHARWLLSCLPTDDIGGLPSGLSAGAAVRSASATGDMACGRPRRGSGLTTR